jgi:hypothetical protein
MLVERFKDYVRELLAGSGHPDIVRVALEQVSGEGGATGVRVEFADGVSMLLFIVRTAPPSGENLSQPEQIVTRSGATQRA